MKFKARPVIVEAFKILFTGLKKKDGNVPLTLENGEHVEATPEMLCRMPDKTVRQGDYWVIQPDSYVYLNPKDVFERKYRAA